MRTAKAPSKSTAKAPKKTPEILSQSEKNLTFALDIGTRSIVGVLGVNEDSVFSVIDCEQQFHAERTMRDGQIENIELVSKVIASVKETLEARNNVKLSTVCIAAAGRTLITKHISHSQDLDPTEEITPRLLHAIEYCALGMAQAEFENEMTGNQEYTSSFYCVGYSVIRYILDGYESSTILGHKGNNVAIDLIAAFLPQNVVQSLYSVTSLNGLTVENLTLEPIAAINVIVPKDIRLLNIALVDIGAGTSDIALSKNGSIVAYDMVTTAGDEVTEMIMKTCLTSFAAAEGIKLELHSTDKIQYTDILGIPHDETAEAILSKISPAIDSLGKSIAERILHINNGPPAAVFMVGGGCQVPGLSQVLSKYLALDEQFIAISGNQPMQNIKLYSPELRNPEFITPIGIGALTSVYRGCDFFSIKVNGKRMMLLNQGESRVLDALLLSSVKPQSLIGISSRAVTYFVNGKRYVKKGIHSVPGELYVNKKPASIDTIIRQGDEIVAKEAVDGKSPIITAGDIIEELNLEICVKWNNTALKFTPTLSINGHTLLHNYVIKPLDDIKTENLPSIKTLFAIAQPGDNIENYSFSINAQQADYTTTLNAGDEITSTHNPSLPNITPSVLEEAELLILDEPEPEILEEAEPQEIVPEISQEATPEAAEEIKPEPIEETKPEIFEKVEPERQFHVCINDVWHNIPVKEGEKLLFFDMLNYVDIDPQNPQGNIILKLNGQNASYTAQVFSRDVVEIHWDN